MTKTSRYKGLVLGSFLVPDIDMILETELGPPLFEALIANSVLVWCVSRLEQRSWRRCLGGLKSGPPRRHRIQSVEGPVLDPRKGNVFKKGSESGPPWNQKWSPWRVQFWPLHCSKFVEAFISSWSWFDQQQLRVEAWTGEVHFCAPTLSYVLRTKKSLSYCFASISIGLRPSRPEACLEACREVFCSNFHGLATLEFETCIEASLFNFVSSYKLFVLLQFPSTWSLEACLEAVPLRQLRPKILARQHSCQLRTIECRSPRRWAIATPLDSLERVWLRQGWTIRG